MPAASAADFFAGLDGRAGNWELLQNMYKSLPH